MRETSCRSLHSKRTAPGAFLPCLPADSAAYLLALAGIYDLLGIDGVPVNLLFQNFSVFADQEVDAARGLIFVDVDAVLAGYFSSPVTQQREGDADLVGEGFVGVGTVHAHTQNLGVGGFQLFEILLEGLHLRSSTTGEGKDVEGQNDVALAAVLAQGNVLVVAAIEVLQFEVGSDVADFQFHGRLGFLALSLDLRTNHRSGEQPDPQSCRNTSSFHGHSFGRNCRSVHCGWERGQSGKTPKRFDEDSTEAHLRTLYNDRVQ